MATKKVGELIKEARTNAGLTQEQLAKKVDNVSASDISKAERGEKELTQAALKQIAKATGVTQASLLNAAKGTSGEKKKTSTTSSSTAKKKDEDDFKLTATEKKLVELYRAADSDTKKAATAVLKGEAPENDSVLGSLLSTAASALMGKK